MGIWLTSVTRLKKQAGGTEVRAVFKICHFGGWEQRKDVKGFKPKRLEEEPQAPGLRPLRSGCCLAADGRASVCAQRSWRLEPMLLGGHGATVR